MNSAEEGKEASGVFYRFSEWRLYPCKRELFRGPKRVSVTPKVFDTLLALVQSRERVVTKEELMALLWPGTFVEEANLTQNISVLRRLLKDSPAHPDFIETIHRHGYRFIHPVEKCVDRGEIVRNGGRGALDLGWTSGRVALVLLALVLGTLTAWLWLGPETRMKAADLEPERIPRLGVLSFRNLGPDVEDDFLGRSLADGIAQKLAYVSGLVLPTSSAVAQVDGIDPLEAGRRLGVDSLLVGTYRRNQRGLNIQAELIDVGDDAVIWTHQWDLDSEGVLTVEDQVAREVLAGLRLLPFPAERRRLHRDVPRDALAYELYLRGVARIAPGSFSVAIDLLESSLEIDPGYAPAWAQLGRAYASHATASFGGARYYGRAGEALEHALRLNSELLDAKRFLAQLYTESDRVEEGVELLISALRVNPNSPETHWDLAYALRYGGLLREARAAVEKALAFDRTVLNRPPNSLLYLGEYEYFLELLETRNDSVFRFYSGLAQFCLADRAAAAMHFRETIDLQPQRSPLSRTYLYMIEGEADRARHELRRFHALLERQGVRDGEFLYKLGQLYAQLGDLEEALNVVSRSVELGFFPVPYFLQDPLIEPVRLLPEWPVVLERAQERHESFAARFGGF
jgi:DNA-binding winged helix-turn-helix (wHTH) protein/TolB-like protein